GRAPPGDQRPDPHQEQQRQPERSQEEVVIGTPDRHGLTPDRLGDEREGDSPEDRQREGDEQEVVVEKGRLARDDRLELRLRAQQRETPEDERERGRRDEADEAEEPWADRALRERVDRDEDAGACEERAEDRQAQGE